MNDSVCIILAGGLGTRLRSVVVDVPKGLAPVRGKPFLAWQLASLRQRGVASFLLALGYGSNQFQQAVNSWPESGTITCITEPTPLGTGGAIAHAMDAAGMTEVLVANGDTFVGGDLGTMLTPLDTTHGELLRIAAVEVHDRSRFGGLEVDERGHVLRFLEKGSQGAGIINAGLYRIHRSALPASGEGESRSYSLESTILPLLAVRDALTATRIQGPFIDIGVPDDYRKFCEQHDHFQ